MEATRIHGQIKISDWKQRGLMVNSRFLIGSNADSCPIQGFRLEATQTNGKFKDSDWKLQGLMAKSRFVVGSNADS